MPEIDFQPDKRTIEDLFLGAEYYVIPRFQRPYSWESSNLDDFWRDVVFDNEVGYFIGPMVAWRDDDSSIRRLVDGQQRMTTVAIMFAVIRNHLTELGETKLAQGVHRYLEKYNRDNEPAYTLQPEVPAPYLNQVIFKQEPDDSVTPSTEEERALSSAANQLQKLIGEEVQKRQDPLKWLLELRNRLLGLRVIWVEHGNEDDAYIIFETLNSRGKDLEVVDLLKNLLLNRLRGNGNAAADAARSKWDGMRNQLEASESRRRIDANAFILHWWLSQEEYVGQRKLFRTIKTKVKSKPAATVRLKSLKHDGPLYRAVIEPASRSWPMEEDQAKRSLSAIALFGVVQPAPLLLSLMRARTAQPKLKAAQFNNTLRTIERYHFQNTVVSQLSSSGGVSAMYAKAARDLHRVDGDPQESAHVLTDIRTKLESRAPERDQFILAFMERFFFTNEVSRDSKLVRYVLENFLRTANPTTGLESLTIEHIMSQDKIGNGEDFETVAVIGNLILVSEPVNTKLGNKAFPAKKAILAAEGKPYDIGGVLDQASWTAGEIEARTLLLAARAYDDVWKL